MTEETIIALKNYDCLIRNKGFSQVELLWECDTLIWGDGGSSMDDLVRPGFTPATRD